MFCVAFCVGRCLARCRLPRGAAAFAASSPPPWSSARSKRRRVTRRHHHHHLRLHLHRQLSSTMTTTSTAFPTATPRIGATRIGTGTTRAFALGRQLARLHRLGHLAHLHRLRQDFRFKIRVSTTNNSVAIACLYMRHVCRPF